jgi:HK97 family phage major capsid protein
VKTLAELKAELADLIKAAKDNTLTTDQAARLDTIKADIESAQIREKSIADGDALLAQFKDAGAPKAPEAVAAKSLGEYFVKSTGADLAGKRGSRLTVSTPEFKASSDVQVTGTVFGNALTSVDTNILTGVRRRLTIEDLLGSEAISGTALTYFVESALVEGAFGLVAENGQKPQLHFGDPTAVTEALSKVAGFIKESDELVEDLPFLKTAIDGRLLYQLNLFIEDQLLNGSGSAGNLRGLLNRVGIQTEVRGSTAAGDNAQDTIFRAITKVETGSGLTADGIVISPADYQTLRLSKDANGQYFGGGFFAGQYGNGNIQEKPPLWGLQTVVTPAIAAGTVLVGAFGQAGSVVSKGGVRVEATNTEGNDFTNNRITVRAERRLALAVRRPAGFVKTTITPVA